MTIGVRVETALFFTATPAHFENAEVSRPVPDGYWDINEVVLPADEAPIAVAYPDLRHPPLRGSVVYSFLFDYYNRIHVYPNPLDFGYIASDTEKQFQVWNAYLEPKYLENISSTGATGLTLTGGPLEAYWYNSLEAITYTVAAGVYGPGITEATYDFNFTGVTTALLKVTGTRVIMFPFVPNWASPIVEHLEWLTSVIETRNGKEQRSKMRQHPRQTIEFDMLLHHEHFQLLSSILFGWQGRAFGVPLWVHSQRLDTGVALSTQVIPVDTDGYEYQLGGSIVLYDSPTVYEVLSIADFNSSQVLTSSATTRAWPAGTLVMPLRIGHLQGAPELRKITGEVLTGVVQFKSQQNMLGEGNWAAAYKGYPVLEQEPQRKDQVREKWDRRVNYIDYGIGQATTFDKDSFSRAVRMHELWGVNRTTIQRLRRYLHYAQGRWKPFWVPTFDRDMQIVETVADNDSTIVIKGIQYAQRVDLHPLRNHIRISLRNGTVHYREIVGADDVNTPPNTETLTVTPAFTTGFTAADIYMVSFMPLCRLESDSVEIGWISPTIANSTLPLRPVMDLI